MRKTFTPAVLLLLLLLSVVSGYAVPNKGEVQGLPTKGLILFMPFNGNANDESGNGNHGKVHGATLTLDRKGNPNGAYHFGGYHKKDYIKVPNSPSLKLDNEITMSIWVKQPLVQGMDGYGYKKDGHSMTLICKDGDRRGFYWMQTNHIQDRDQIIEFAGTWTGKNYGQVKSAPIHFSATKWKHYAVTYDLKRRTAKLFYNGKLISTKKYHHPDIFKQANNYDLYIGVFGYVGLWFPFEGELDDIRIYNRALSDKEVKAIYTQDSPQNNTTPPDPTPGDYSNYSLKIHTWKSGLNENNLQYIAADGTSSIVLEVTGGKIPKGTTLTINSDDNKDFGTVYLPNMSLIRPENMYNAKWTPINKSISNLESSFIKYVAPAGLGDIKNNERIITFTITLPDNSKLTKKIKLIRPPVVFIHGKGSSKEAWNEMYNHFAKSNLYKSKNEIPFHFYAYDYNKYAEESFKDNTEKNRIVQRAITTVKTGLTLQGVLVKKVDVVGHSMGGVLTRTYLQSKYYYDDIRRMITISTPHSGSQGANVADIADFSPPFKGLLWTVKQTIGVDFLSKATKDLRVDSWATRQYLNGKEALEKQKIVPSFAIAAQLDWFSAPKFMSAVHLKILELVNFFLLQQIKPFVDHVREIHEGTPEHLIDYIYGGPNDGVVATKSQLGGHSEDHHTVFKNACHLDVTENMNVIASVLKLLQTPKSDKAWCHTGWKPLKLNPIPWAMDHKGKIKEKLQSESSFVRFVPDKEEDNAVAGKEYTLNLEHSSDVVELDVLVLGENYENLLNMKNPTSPTNIKISIPDSLIGDLHIMAFGKTADSSVVVDNLLLHLKNHKIELENISLEFPNTQKIITHTNVPLHLKVSELEQFSVMGHFNDGSVREITDFPGVEFTLSNNNVHIKKPGVLLAKKQGTEKLVVTYKEKSVSQKINISPHTLELVAFPKNSGIVGISDVQINSDSVEVKTLLPLAAKDYTFSGWFMDGEFVSYDKKLELPMIRPYQVVAYFEPKTGAAKIKGFAFPNPVKDNVTLSFDVVTPGVYTFELYQELGEHLQTINKKYFNEGTHTIEFNTQALAPGRYFCQILRQGVSLGEIAFVVTK